MPENDFPWHIQYTPISIYIAYELLYVISRTCNQTYIEIKLYRIISFEKLLL